MNDNSILAQSNEQNINSNQITSNETINCDLNQTASNQSNNSNRSNDEDPNGCFESDDFNNNNVQEALESKCNKNMNVTTVKRSFFKSKSPELGKKYFNFFTDLQFWKKYSPRYKRWGLAYSDIHILQIVYTTNYLFCIFKMDLFLLICRDAFISEWYVSEWSFQSDSFQKLSFQSDRFRVFVSERFISERSIQSDHSRVFFPE